MDKRIEFKLEIPYIDIHTHHPVDSEEIIAIQSLFLQDIDLANEIDNPFSTAIHPWHADKFDSPDIEVMLNKLYTQKNLIAIGETGLDKICAVDYELQNKVFALQINYAETYQKPLIIHAVKSWNQLIPIFKHIKVPVILHGYSEGLPLTRELIDLGCYFSLGKSILNPSPRFLEAIQVIPVSNLFMETDESLVTIEEIYQKMADSLNLSLELLKIHIHNNFTVLFH